MYLQSFASRCFLAITVFVLVIISMFVGLVPHFAVLNTTIFVGLIGQYLLKFRISIGSIPNCVAYELEPPTVLLM